MNLLPVYPNAAYSHLFPQIAQIYADFLFIDLFVYLYNRSFVTSSFVIIRHQLHSLGNTTFPLRRILQLGLLLLFGGANRWGQNFLMGDYPSAFVPKTFYLENPHTMSQSMEAGFIMSTDTIIGAAIVLAFYALVAGRSFCSWVCPVNMLTDLATWIMNLSSICDPDKA